MGLLTNIILLYAIIITNIYRKSDFAEVSKKVKYRSENDFVGLSK